jgi:hypothetical protein
MALVVKDRVKETTTTTGTGTLTLLGAATGFQAFSVIGDGNTTYYTITNGTDFEVGIGTYTSSGTTLSRDTILESSNSGNAVNWGAGTKDVFVTYPAERSVYTDAAGTAITPATASVLDVVSGGTGASSLTSNNVILGNGTSAVQFVAPGSSGNVLTSNGSTWTSAAAAAFDAGTRMIFAQTTAPTGWTKDTTNYNNHALRVVTGSASTGGTVDFTAAFTSQTPSGTVTVSASTGQITQGGTISVTVGNTTLSSPQIPGHTHTLPGRYGYTRTNNSVSPGNNSQPPYTPNTGSTGGGGSHTHPGSGSFTGSQHNHPVSAPASFSGSAINLAVKYLDVITATKN